MTTGFAANIGVTLKSANFDAQKIDGSILETYGIVSVELLL